MRGSSLVFAASAVAIAGAIAGACGSFGDGDTDEPASPIDGSTADGPLGSEAGTENDAGSDGAAAVDAGSCKGGRDAGLKCGINLCSSGQVCCLSPTTICGAATGCPAAPKKECESQAECGQGSSVCCQIDGGSTETRCQTSCTWGAPLCEKDSDCKPGEYCREPDSSRKLTYFHCAPCP